LFSGFVFWIPILGFGLLGLRLRFSDFGVYNLGFGVRGLEFGVQGLGFRAWGSGFGIRFRVLGFGS
jgi:hypothetical protein